MQGKIVTMYQWYSTSIGGTRKLAICTGGTTCVHRGFFFPLTWVQGGLGDAGIPDPLGLERAPAPLIGILDRGGYLGRILL